MKLRTICRCDEDGPLDGRIWGVVTLYGEGRSSTHYVDCPLVQEACVVATRVAWVAA